MKTGDIVTDSRARAWTLGPLLGEGVWGRTWSVRDDEGRQRALKAPYEASELPPASADRAALMRACAEEQAELLASHPAWFVPLEDRITLPTGSVALLFPLMPTTLQRQLQSGLPLAEAMRELLAVVDLLEKLKVPHGNLRPSNILVDPHGAPLLADAATPSAISLLSAAERAPNRRRWAPPDHAGSDAWAVCQALYTSVLADEGRSDASTGLPVAPMEGLDKVARAALRDHAMARLKEDGANPRFIARTSERLVAVLARGLSKELDPSPPYRFLRPAELRPRLAEVVALVHPTVESVGKLLLSSRAQGEVFSGPGPVEFSVSIALSEGLTDPRDVVSGIRLVDLDAEGDGRVSVEQAQVAADKHPSGRLRYEFVLPDVPPGRYLVRVGFSVRDSGDEPVAAEGTFEVRPPPGYVPPRREEGPSALAFPGRPTPAPAPRDAREDDEEEDAEDGPTVLMRSPPVDDDRGFSGFPRPLSPTAPGTEVEGDDEDEPPPSRPAPRPLAVVGAARPGGHEDPESEDPSLDLDAPLMQYARPSPVAMPAPAPRPSPVAPAPAPAPVMPVAPAAPPVAVAPPAVPPPVALAAPPVVVAPPPAPAPLPAHEEWQASQVEEADFFGAGAVPGGAGDDLLAPRPSGPSTFERWRTWFVELVQRDSPTALGGAIAVCFLLIVVALLLTRAC